MYALSVNSLSSLKNILRKRILGEGSTNVLEKPAQQCTVGGKSKPRQEGEGLGGISLLTLNAEDWIMARLKSAKIKIAKEKSC